MLRCVTISCYCTSAKLIVAFLCTALTMISFSQMVMASLPSESVPYRAVFQSRDVTNDTLTADELNYQLLVASGEGKVSEIIRLLNLGADINTTSDEGVTPLMYAVDAGHIEAVHALLLNGADTDTLPQNGISALHAAVALNHASVAELLVEYGADIDLRDATGITPLMYAASYGFFEIVDMLLYYGANTELTDPQGNTVLLLAALAGNSNIIDLLFKAGCDIYKTDHKGYSAVMCAAQAGDTATIRMLHEKGADINGFNNQGYNALAIAVMNEQAEAATLLLRLGADPNARYGSNPDVLTLADETNNRELMNLIRTAGGRKKQTMFFARVPVGIGINLNTSDISTGFFTGVEENASRLSLQAGASARLFAKRLLVDSTSTGVFLQLWEKRYSAWVSLEKTFSIARLKNQRNLRAHVAVSELFTWGSYRGMEKSPVTGFFTIPRAGMGIYGKNFGYRISYDRVPLDLYHIPDGRITVEFVYFFSLIPVKERFKKVNWW